MNAPSPAYCRAGLVSLIAQRFARKLTPRKSTNTTIHPFPLTRVGAHWSAIPDVKSRNSRRVKARIAPKRCG